MKAAIHPKYEQLEVTCNCGNSFVTKSTLGKANVRIEVCSECHSFYTGKRKIMDTEGKVQQFMRRYGINKTEDKKQEDTK